MSKPKNCLTERGPATRASWGGGRAGSLELAFAEVKKFESLPRISSMVRSAKFDEKARVLRLEVEAFHYRAQLPMKIDFQEAETNRRSFDFRVLDGPFQNLQGSFLFEDLEHQTTEFSMTAQMGFVKLPLPRFFVEFGLEVALQLVAKNMRSFIEDNCDSNKGAAHDGK
ncbi:MAG: hypothetical protein IPK68_22460 [Bdellovibrionales bacterium]|nr:hypothetical protein [Bdellovibrionales bacterium]